MDLSRQFCLFALASLVTVGLYFPHLSDGWVYQDHNYAYTVSPGLVHTLSLALHLLNGLLVWVIGRSLGLPGSAWIAAIFLIHPLNTEAVAYGAAQSELIILASVLLAIWSCLNRWWLAVILPAVALSSTKVASFWSVLVHPDVNAGVAQGVSYLTWWSWEATAALRYLALWVLPRGLSNDHDVVHVSWGLWALAGLVLAVCAGLIQARKLPLPVLIALGWMLVVLFPRFLVRNPLSPLNEHHWYPVTVGLSMLTVFSLSKLGVVR